MIRNSVLSDTPYSFLSSFMPLTSPAADQNVRKRLVTTMSSALFSSPESPPIFFFNHLCDFHVYLCMAFSFLLLSFSTEIISSLCCRTGTLGCVCTTSQKHINSGFCSCPSHHVPQACASISSHFSLHDFMLER
ncbi:hypothetical protein DsansV1_C27g0198661 [Dioscorea sansibarensis]